MSPMLAGITREFVISNYIEAGLWVALGLGAAAQAFRFTGVVRRDLVILAIDLIAFGLSDIVETRTGAWWRPPWLLVWKVTCVAVIFALLARYVMRRMKQP